MNFRVPGRISTFDAEDRQHLGLPVVTGTSEEFQRRHDSGNSLFVQLGLRRQLFLALNSKEIAEALQQQYGVDIDRRKIILPERIKDLGVAEVTLKLHPQVHPTLRVQVSAEEN